MSGFWGTVGDWVEGAAKGIATTYAATKILERSPSEAFRELARRSYSDSQNDFQSLRNSIESMANYGSQQRAEATQLLRRYDSLDSCVNGLVKSFNNSPSIARLEIIRHSEEMPSDLYSDLVFLLILTAQRKRSEPFAVFAEYAESRKGRS